MHKCSISDRNHLSRWTVGTCVVCTAGNEVFRCSTADFCCLWPPSPAQQTALCQGEAWIRTSMWHEHSLSDCWLHCIVARKTEIRPFQEQARTPIAIARHPEQFVPSYSKLVMQIAWRALRLWRCPARSHTSLSGVWSSSAQLAPHHTVGIDQRRDCYSTVRTSTGFFSPCRYTQNLCS